MNKELVKTANARKSAQELKIYFLEHAEPLVKQYIDAAIGNTQLQGVNATAREEVWDVLKQLMLQSSDKLDIEIKTAQDVLDAVSTGKCTFEEGDKLLKLFKQMKEINQVGMLPGSSEGGLTINILSANQPTEVKEVIDHEETKV